MRLAGSQPSLNPSPVEKKMVLTVVPQCKSTKTSFLVTPLQRPEASACNLMCTQNKLIFSKRFLVITFIAYQGIFLVVLV